MKPSSRAPGIQDDESGKEDNEPQSAKSPLQPTPVGPVSPSRPHLVRAPPRRLSEIQRSPLKEDNATLEASTAHDMGEKSPRDKSDDGERRPATNRASSGNSEDARLAKLKDAVNAKILMQQRKGGNYHVPTPPGGIKRVSPISEEGGGISPSLNAAFASPPETGPRPMSTVSTESTDSARTVRNSRGNTPAEQRPLRTPSYPFPLVSTPRKWSSPGLHQPFTTLSPTVSGLPHADRDTYRKDSQGSMSGHTTPPGGVHAASSINFRPTEDPRFPTPDLYNMILQLNTEPGIEQWWTTVTNVMHDSFKAERVSLSMPMDPTDIENVPWGQKATFSMNGREEFVPHRTVLEQLSHGHQSTPRAEGNPREAGNDSFRGAQKQRLHTERLRPRLESRHSYAGNGRDVETPSQNIDKSTGRPGGPNRTLTHAPSMTAGNYTRTPAQRTTSSSTIHHTSLSDPDFSSIGANFEAGPYAEVFQASRALDREMNPLIEPGGVNQVLERGRVVTVTRDYNSEEGETNTENKPTEANTPNSPAGKNQTEEMFGAYRNASGAAPRLSIDRGYAEYEQIPCSPWAQSPAPSPAMQADEDANPFFKDSEPVEDSFDPMVSPKDYSQYGQVEAIGVDRSSTVIHIPLVHPTLSQPMHLFKQQVPSDLTPGNQNIDMEHRAPIAILSVLSPTVPYPPNFTQSLALLGPHLATSFAIAQQFSASHHQTVSIRHRRTASGNHALNAPMTIEPMSLDDLLNAEFNERPGSTSSITSPSDYSGRSGYSPSGSIVETPGWDPASHGWTSSRSVAGTPLYSGSEMVDNYFDSKKRAVPRNSSNASISAQNTPQRVGKSFTLQEPRGGVNTQSTAPNDGRAPRSDQKSKSGRLSGSPPRHAPAKEQSPTRHGDTAPNRQNLLHSKGADFESSFGMLGSVAVGTPTGHARKSSFPEDMPPPSERLLRTIIDSVPVQIFTAKPDTGHLSWVNSKFLIYRGLEPQQVLSDPWQAIHPDDREQFLSAWHRSLRTAQQLQQKVRLERFDGSFRWFYVRAAPLKDKRQRIVHWIGTMMDFHEQHLAEMNASRQQETAASEAKYRTLANSSPQIVFAVGRSRGVTFCNTQWLHYSGQTEAEALGAGFMDHVHPDDLSKCRLPTFKESSNKPTNVPTSVPSEPMRSWSSPTSPSAFSDTAESSTPTVTQMPQRKLSQLAATGILKVTRDADGRPSYSTEVRLKSREGDYRWHLVRVLLAEPMLQDHVDEETWYGTCTDINDHKTLERDLKETMDEKSRFLSNMSHEIRTPLNGITGMVNFLIDSSLTSEQMEHVNIIRASTEGLRGLINDILDLSKAEAGMIALNMDWLYVRALLEEVNDLTSAMAIDKGLELNYLVEEDVPTQVKGDRFRLRQILLNIVGNAIKFTQLGEVFVRCSTMPNDDEISNHERYLKFEIIDTGSGFTEKEAEYLFKRFSQIDGSSTRQHGGTGLGLVISRQLAQLHGGDMSAKGVPGEGSTFAFYIKAALPTEGDKPPSPVPTPGSATFPGLPARSDRSSGSLSNSSLPLIPKLRKTSSGASSSSLSPAKPPRYVAEYTQSPMSTPVPIDMSRQSPGHSSASSDPSLRSVAPTDSLRSQRSSASSLGPDPVASMKLTIPPQQNQQQVRTPESDDSNKTNTTEKATSPRKDLLAPTNSFAPPMYSILVLCPLKYSREATVEHISKTLPGNIPHQITARGSLLECQKLIGGDDPVQFTHIVVVLQEVDEITVLVDQVLHSPAHPATSIVIITDLAQRRKILEQAPQHDYEALNLERRVRFVFKPLKPSRFAIIFDPRKEREMSTDRNQDSAQQVAVNQKQVFEDLLQRLGDRGKRVLLVEDNKVNQMVLLKFLSKVSVTVETAMDGVQCTDMVFAKPPDYYSIILCDLHMPNKDGYQTCKEIRKWEHTNKYAHLPIIALSANVLGDVYQKCAEAGFNSYMTKPVDFKELSTVLVNFMDPDEPDKPHEFMKFKREPHKVSGR